MTKAKYPPAKYYADAAVATELIGLVKAVITDPLITTMGAWWWLAKRADVNLLDGAALRAGIIDINGARAKVDNSIVLQALGQATDLAGELGKGLGVAAGAIGGGAAGGPAGAIAGGAAGIMSGKNKGKRNIPHDEVSQALQTLSDAGYRF